MVWSILLCMILAIIGAIVPDSITLAINRSIEFVYKEKVTLIVIGILLLIIGIFIPVLIFASVGLVAGGTLSLSMKNKANFNISNKPSDKPSDESSDKPSDESSDESSEK